jgi:hypothetical protein
MSSSNTTNQNQAITTGTKNTTGHDRWTLDDNKTMIKTQQIMQQIVRIQHTKNKSMTQVTNKQIE